MIIGSISNLFVLFQRGRRLEHIHWVIVQMFQHRCVFPASFSTVISCCHIHSKYIIQSIQTKTRRWFASVTTGDKTKVELEVTGYMNQIQVIWLESTPQAMIITSHLNRLATVLKLSSLVKCGTTPVPRDVCADGGIVWILQHIAASADNWKLQLWYTV